MQILMLNPILQEVKCFFLLLQIAISFHGTVLMIDALYIIMDKLKIFLLGQLQQLKILGAYAKPLFLHLPKYLLILPPLLSIQCFLICTVTYLSLHHPSLNVHQPINVNFLTLAAPIHIQVAILLLLLQQAK